MLIGMKNIKFKVLMSIIAICFILTAACSSTENEAEFIEETMKT